MQTKKSDSLKSQHWSDIITCGYLGSLLACLHYNNCLYLLGQFDAVYIIGLLFFLEIIKYMLSSYKSATLRKKNVKDTLKIVTVLTGTFSLFYVIAVLLGAPVFSNFQQTAIFSSLLTVVAILPCCLHFGPDITINMLLTITQLDQQYIDDCCHYFMLIKLRLILFGAWLGAIFIPLDWSRPWQVWPIPCCLGGLFGGVVANLITSFQQFYYYKRKLFRKTGKSV